MKRLIIGVAAAGMACLLGCKTDMSVAGSSSETMTPTRIAQNPDIVRGANGPLIKATVVADYADALIVRDDHGFERTLRVDEQTLYRKPDGDIVARTYLAPGSRVRTAFDNNNNERIAREVIIDKEKTQCELNAWPEEPTPYHRNP